MFDGKLAKIKEAKCNKQLKNREWFYLDDGVLCCKVGLKFLAERRWTDDENGVKKLEKLNRVENPGNKRKTNVFYYEKSILKSIKLLKWF